MKTLFINNSNTTTMSSDLIQEVALAVATQAITYMEEHGLNIKNSSLILKWECGNMFGFHIKSRELHMTSPCLCVFQNLPPLWEREDIYQITMAKVRKHFIDKWTVEHSMSEHEKRVQSLKELAERHKGELLEVWALDNLEQAIREHTRIQSSIDRYLDRCEREREYSRYHETRREQFRSDWLDYEEMYLNRMGVL